MSESFWTITFLTFSGGLQDAYTYFGRGKVFANAFTGNLVLMASKLFEGDFGGVVHYLIPAFFFACGIFAAQLMRMTLHHKKLHWRQFVILIEIVLLVLSVWIPSNLAANSMISFACAMQVQSFRKVHGYPMASTMCLGNMRSAMDGLAQYVLSRKPAHLQKTRSYLRVIFIFFLGAGTGSVLTKYFGHSAILVSAGLLTITLFVMFIKDEQREENRLSSSKQSLNKYGSAK